MDKSRASPKFFLGNRATKCKGKRFHNGPGRWLMPLILAIQEVETGRVAVKANPGKKFSRSHFKQ
jgi:hypothetical protein